MIYADYNGSAPLAPDVKEYLIDRLNKDGPYANPNAIHFLGSKCLMAIEKSRKICAEALGAEPYQIIFNSGASEGISTIFNSLCGHAANKGKKLIFISGIEHAAVVNAALSYRQHGLEVITIPTLKNGQVDIAWLGENLRLKAEKTALVCVMAANNETGVIQPFQEISQMCQRLNLDYFCDTTQFIGKAEFNFKESGLEYAVLSGHKLGALPGTGILLVKNPEMIVPLIHGGEQENGLRGGTQNYIGIETLAVALKYLQKNMHRLEGLKAKRLEFENKMKSQFPKIVIVGEASPRLAGTSLIANPGIHGQAVQIELESQDIFVTTSSACSDNQPLTSKVLKSMGVDDDVGRGVIRIGMGLCSPLESYQQINDSLIQAYVKLEKINSF